MKTIRGFLIVAFFAIPAGIAIISFLAEAWIEAHRGGPPIP
jgi:hypothetical protein